MTDACTPEKWILYPNVHIFYGVLKENADTVALCKQECVRNGSCTGIDWHRMGWDTVPRYHCWLHGPWTAGNFMAAWDEVDHYQLRKYACASQQRK